MHMHSTRCLALERGQMSDLMDQIHAHTNPAAALWVLATNGAREAHIAQDSKQLSLHPTSPQHPRYPRLATLTLGMKLPRGNAGVSSPCPPHTLTPVLPTQ